MLRNGGFSITRANIVRHGNTASSSSCVRRVSDWSVPALGVAAVASVTLAARLWQLELRSQSQASIIRQTEERLTEAVDEHREKIRDFSQQIVRLQSELQNGRDKWNILSNNIAHRGKIGETDMTKLLENLRDLGLLADFSLQTTQKSGNRPDAVGILKSGRTLMIDAKVPDPEKCFAAFQSDDMRKAFVDDIKSHVRDLHSRNYHGADSNALNRTILLLPSEDYIKAAFRRDCVGLDDMNLHGYANDRAVWVTGPHGLRAIIEALNEYDREIQQTENDKEAERIEALEPLWLQRVMPTRIRLSRALKKVIQLYNEDVENQIDFDTNLRAKLEVSKARKKDLPKTLPDMVAIPTTNEDVGGISNTAAIDPGK